jgi:hypothetical protein
MRKNAKNTQAVNTTVTVTATEEVVATTATATATTATAKVRVRNLLRDALYAAIVGGEFGDEGQHSTAVRKRMLQFVIDNGGAKNSGPAEYNTVMLELIGANSVRKVARGVYVAVTKA